MTNNQRANIHLDSSVIFTFFVFMLLGVGLLSFRLSQKESCSEVFFTISDQEVEVGQMIYVRDKSALADNWQWDFGDNTGKSDKSYATYAYAKPGTYEIVLTINNQCVGSKTIQVNKPKEGLDPKLFPLIIVPETIVEGEKVTFTATGPDDAESWAWRFGESVEVDATQQEATYTFKNSGPKTITLIVNDREKYITKRKIEVEPKLQSIENTTPSTSTPIIINDKPIEQEITEQISEMRQQLPPPPQIEEVASPQEEVTVAPKPKIKAPAISEADFANLLVAYSKGDTPATVFVPYLCNDTTIPVVANGEKMTWTKLINKINRRKLKFKSLHIVKDQNNCIKSIKMETKREIK